MSEKIDPILEQVEPARRTFLKRMLGGSALALIALPASSVIAEELELRQGKGKKGDEPPPTPPTGKKGGKKGKKGGGKGQ